MAQSLLLELVVAVKLFKYSSTGKPKELLRQMRGPLDDTLPNCLSEKKLCCHG